MCVCVCVCVCVCARACACVCVVVVIVHWHCSAQLSIINMEKRYRNKNQIKNHVAGTLTLNVLYHITPHKLSPEQDSCSINYFNFRGFEGSESFSFMLCLLVKTDIQELNIS